MSAAVELSALAERLEEFPSVAYLVSVDGDGRPHVVAVEPVLAGDRILAGAGRRTAANLAQRAACTLLWPAPAGSGYGLLVDGVAEVVGNGDARRLVVRPTGAVLHRTPTGDPSLPSCVAVPTGPAR